MTASGWVIEQRSGTAQALHDIVGGSVERPTVWILTPVRPALVLGPSQTPTLVDPVRAQARGIEVCRRRSGGGVVLVDPAASVWIDVVVPVSEQGPTSDPARLFRWVGGVWLRALRRLGLDGLALHEGRLTDRERARLLCFAGFGPGEVLQRTPDGPSKVVGLSQRRTRTAARVQGLFVARWEADVLLDVLRPGAWPPDLDPTDVRVGLRGGVVPTRQQVTGAVLGCLPALGQNPVGDD